MAYLSSYVPEPNAAQRSVKTSWAGLNRKQTQDSGELSEAHNISVRELPYLKSADGVTAIWQALGDPQDTYAPNIREVHDVGEGNVIVLAQDTRMEDSTCVYYGKIDPIAGYSSLEYIGSLQDPSEYVPRSVAVFNAYIGNNIVTSQFNRIILIFPDALSFDPTSTGADRKLKSISTSNNPIPNFKHITVLNGRLFGVLDGKIFASEWNNYANFYTPNADELDEDVSALPWISTTQSDIDASGEFTGITVYGGQVIGFKRNFMHMIYNNKNPFRIVDIAKVGAISQAAICEVNQALFFIADDGVYAFTGGVPTRISDKLNIPAGNWERSILGGDDRTLYCYNYGEDVIYTYDTVNGAWGAISQEISSVNMATVSDTCLFGFDEEIYRVGGSRNHAFDFTTDITFGGSLVEKKIKRLRLQVSHPTHNADDHIEVSVLKSDGTWTATKEYRPRGECNTVLSMLTRMTCDFGQKIRVEGQGDWVIKYLQLDYESGGEKYV